MDWSEQQVRQEVRSWLDSNWDPNTRLIEWRNKLVDSGWGMPSWPEQWFGKDIPAAMIPIVQEEFAQLNAVGVARTGIRLLAAETLLAHGTDEQRERFLRKILTGEEIWCQLFSEPGSGSDLAGVTTRAELVEGEWVINGQKVWTTSAHHADYGLLLARSNWDVPKHQGMTYFVVDMRQEGVEVSPLKQMNGHASFNQVFFTDARIPLENRIDEEGNGWRVAMTTLAYERRAANALAGDSSGKLRDGTIYEEVRREDAVLTEPYTWYPQRAGRVDLAIERAAETNTLEDVLIRQELARLLMMAQCSEWTALRARAAQEKGQPQGPEGSLGKLANSYVARQALKLHTMTTGLDSMLEGEIAPMNGLISEILLSVPAISIAGGTDEIQKNIIAERVLGMDKEPRLDGGPFRDVRKN